MLAILVGLCAVLSVLTLSEHGGSGAAGGEELAEEVVRQVDVGGRVAIVTGEGQEDKEFADSLERVLKTRSATVAARLEGSPCAVRLALEKMELDHVMVDAVAVSARVGRWAVLEDFQKRYPRLGPVKIIQRESMSGRDSCK